MKFDGVFTVKQEVTKEQFLRRLLIHLSSAQQTPVDITKSVLGEVTESYKEAIACEAHVECDYTASIGYDREEEYWDKEEKYNSSTQRWEKVDVKRTRTVTDWRPHSGHIAGDAICMAFNEKSELSEIDQHELLREVLMSIDKNDLVVEGEAEVSDVGFETVKNACHEYVALGIEYPGDHVDDESSSATVNVIRLLCYRLPYYEVDFVYDDKKYHAGGFACNESHITTELPPDNDDVAATAELECGTKKALKSAGWCIFAGTWFLSFVLALTTDGIWSVFLPLVAFVVALGLHISYNNKYNNLIKSLKEDSIQTKLSELQQTLKQYNYEQLTDEEMALFDAQTAGEEYGATHNKRGIALPFILGTVAIIVLLVVAL